MTHPAHEEFITAAVRESADEFPQILRDFVNATKIHSVLRAKALHLLFHVGKAMANDYEKMMGNPCRDTRRSAGQIYKAAFCFQAVYYLSNNNSKLQIEAAKHFNDAMVFIRKLKYGRDRTTFRLPLVDHLGPRPQND